MTNRPDWTVEALVNRGVIERPMDGNHGELHPKASDFVKDGIHMNAVDTGWVTDEDPAVHAARKAESGFSPPLDIIDGAARIVDPIFVGKLTGTHMWGQFLKDYKPAPW